MLLIVAVAVTIIITIRVLLLVQIIILMLRAAVITRVVRAIKEVDNKILQMPSNHMNQLIIILSNWTPKK